jgi:hypothetical protein
MGNFTGKGRTGKKGPRIVRLKLKSGGEFRMPEPIGLGKFDCVKGGGASTQGSSLKCVPP